MCHLELGDDAVCSSANLVAPSNQALDEPLHLWIPEGMNVSWNGSCFLIEEERWHNAVSSLQWVWSNELIGTARIEPGAWSQDLVSLHYQTQKSLFIPWATGSLVDMLSVDQCCLCLCCYYIWICLIISRKPFKSPYAHIRLWIVVWPWTDAHYCCWAKNSKEKCTLFFTGHSGKSMTCPR